MRRANPENPDLEYFCEQQEFITEQNFNPIMLVQFRKHFLTTNLKHVNKVIVDKASVTIKKVMGETY